MARMKQLFLDHKFAVILALFVSILAASPQVVFRIQHAHDGVYQGIELLPDNSWPPRVREIQDGHGFGSIYYKDGKNDPYVLQPFGSTVVAYMGEVFSLNINDTLLLTRFVLSFFVFLLIYAFVFVLSRDRLAALCGSSMLLLVDAVMNLSSLRRLIYGISPSNFLNIGLPVNPAMIFIPLFGFLTAFWLFYRKGGWRLWVLSAFLLGLNFYTYFYSWTYLYAFGGLLVLMYLVQKKWGEAARITGVFLGALLVAIPYGINLYRASLFATYQEVSMRFGIIASHTPLFVGFVVIVALAVFLIGFPREDKEKYFFGLALLLAPFVTLNQQIVTGKLMQEAHYHWYFHKPMAILFVVMTVFYLLGRLKTVWYKRAFATLVIIASFAVGIFIQTDSYLHNRGDGGTVAVERQQYGPVMQWLNQNAKREDVVLSNDPVSYLVTIYTSLNVFSHRGDYIALSATRERLLDTIFTFYRIRGISAKDAHNVFFAERKDISIRLYGIYYRQLAGSYEAIPDEDLNNIIALYEKTLSTPTSEWLAQKMTQYQVNYVVWDKVNDPSWNLDRFAFLHKETQLGNFIIYRFNPQ